MNYYHITKLDQSIIKSILTTGLRANDGMIFLFENKSFRDSISGVENTISECIANNQLFLDEYAMFEISSEGITVELVNDNVGESTSKYQWICYQPVIEPKFINLFGTYRTDYKPFIE